ncbi:hypothetical protein FBU30_004675 [Linnemannia zychae]|nr:hypothetical protein FBU30_004675 [Linnemannia zychae]
MEIGCIFVPPIPIDPNGKQWTLVWGTESSSVSSCAKERSILLPLAMAIAHASESTGPSSVLVMRLRKASRMVMHIFGDTRMCEADPLVTALLRNNMNASYKDNCDNTAADEIIFEVPYLLKHENKSKRQVGAYFNKIERNDLEIIVDNELQILSATSPHGPSPTPSITESTPSSPSLRPTQADPNPDLPSQCESPIDKDTKMKSKATNQDQNSEDDFGSNIEVDEADLQKLEQECPHKRASPEEERNLADPTVSPPSNTKL